MHRYFDIHSNYYYDKRLCNENFDRQRHRKVKNVLNEWNLCIYGIFLLIMPEID